MIYGSFPSLKYQRWENRRGKKERRRIYQYLYHKLDVMVILILFPTFCYANQTRGSICFIPPVENTQLDCCSLLSSCDANNNLKLYSFWPYKGGK